MLVKILNGFFCLTFILFAWFNLNDKDSWLWVPIYLLAALCCGLVVIELYYPGIYLSLIAVYLIYAIFLFFVKDGALDWFIKYDRQSITESMQATKPYIEKTREFFGLLILAAALTFNYFFVRNLG